MYIVYFIVLLSNDLLLFGAMRCVCLPTIPAL